MEVWLAAADLGCDRVNAFAAGAREIMGGAGVVFTVRCFLLHLLLFKKELGRKSGVSGVDLARAFLILEAFNELGGEGEGTFVIRSTRGGFTDAGEVGGE